MSLIDAIIPGVFGVLLVIWPHSVFIGSKVTPDAKKLKLMRRLGGGLCGIATILFVVWMIDLSL